MEDLPTGEERVASWEANTLHLSESKEVSRLGEGLTMHSLLEGKPNDTSGGTYKVVNYLGFFFFFLGKHLWKAVACEMRLQFKTVKLTNAGVGYCG